MINKLKNYFIDNYTIGITSFIVGVTIYLPSMILHLTNGDGYWNSETFKTNYAWENALGRYGLSFIGKLFGNYSSSTISIPITIFLLIIIGGIICDLFNIKGKLNYLLVNILLMFSMSMSTTLSFHYSSIGYISSFLLAVLSVYVSYNNKNLIVSALLLTFSISIYQGYIGVSITLIVMKLIQIIINNEEIKPFLIKSLLYGIIGTILYLIIAKNGELLFGIGLIEGRGFSEMGTINISMLPELIIRAYTNWFDFYFTNSFINNSWYYKNFINLVLYLLLLFIIIYKTYINKIYENKLNLILLIILIITIPICLSIMSILSPHALSTDITGLLMVPQTVLFYIFIFVFIEDFKYIKQISILLLSAFVFIQIIYTSIFINFMETSLRQSYTMANTMMHKICDKYEYIPGMKVAIVGKADNFYFDLSNEHQRYILKGTPIKDGMFWNDYSGQQHGWINFLRNYMAIDFSIVYIDEFNSLINEKVLKEMGSFPNDNSIIKKDDIVIIKLGDIEY